MMALALLLVSAILLRLERKTLSSLGFNQPRRRALEFAVGFAVFALAAVVQQWGYAWQADVSWRTNADFTGNELLRRIAWDVNSVASEELLFRGYFLLQLLRFTGPRLGLWISAAAFGVYHWFTFGILGNIPAMIVVFLFTGAFGLMLAYAFQKTGSLAAPMGLHLGWNMTIHEVFSGGPLGKAWLVPSNGVVPLRTDGLWGFVLGVALPLVVTALVAWWISRRQPSDLSSGRVS